MQHRFFVIACLLFAGVVGIASGPREQAFASSNSDAAHACQHGGFTAQIGTDGTTDTTFASVGECVSFKAHGGVLVSLAAAQPCLANGFSTLTTPGGSAPFATEAACVLFVGQGGVPVLFNSSPALNGSITGPSASVPGSCALLVTGSDLAPGSTVMLNVLGSGSFTLVQVDGTPVTVASNGTVDLTTYVVSGYTVSLSAVTASGATISTGWFDSTC